MIMLPKSSSLYKVQSHTCVLLGKSGDYLKDSLFLYIIGIWKSAFVWYYFKIPFVFCDVRNDRNAIGKTGSTEVREL